MALYNVGACSTYEGRKCGNLSGWVKLKGIHFILKNNIFFGQPFFMGSTDSDNSSFVTERSFYQSVPVRSFYKPYEPLIDSVHDLLSTDLDYLNEVQKLKSIFSINPHATLKAYKMNSNYNYGTLSDPIYYEYQFFIFDFEDIFLSNEIHTFSSSWWRSDSSFDNYVNNWFDRYFIELGYLDFDFQKNVIQGHQFKSLNASSFQDHLGVPILDNRVVSARSSAFLVDGVIYVFKINNFPVFNSPKTAVAFSWDVYKIPIKQLCCLAQCFGITE